MRTSQLTVSVVSKGIRFFKRQPRDWKVTVARSSLARFVYQMIFPYQSIYTVALGATATQLGIVNSAGMGVAGLLSPPVGWLIDRIGIKTVTLNSGDGEGTTQPLNIFIRFYIEIKGFHLPGLNFTSDAVFRIG